MPKFSIVIPIYNREKYLTKTLQSVLNQTFKNIEVICVDDFSTDSSLDMLREFEKKDTRINIVVQPENLGTHMARKTGVQKASGDYILFLDCDDELTTNACEILIDALNKQKSDIIEFAYNETSVRHPVLPRKDITIDNFFSSLIYPKYFRAGTIWNKVYSANLLKNAFSKMSDFYSIMGEDYYESVVIAYYTQSYYSINTAFYHYMHNEEQSTSFKKKDVYQIKKYSASIANNIHALNSFFENYALEHKLTIPNIESSFLYYIFYSQILRNVDKSQWRQCFEVLPNYFSDKALSKYKHKMQSPLFCIALEYNAIAFIKRLFPQSFKSKVKQLLQKQQERF